MGNPLQAPRPRKGDTNIVTHGIAKADPYAHLRDDERSNPTVIAHLEAENTFTDASLAHLEELRATIFTEMKSRAKLDDDSVPSQKGAFWYFFRSTEAGQYGKHLRRRGGADGPEEVILDEDALAEGHDFFSTSNLSISPNANLLSYATDFEGNEEFQLHIRDLSTGQDLPDTIDDVEYGVAWSSDSASIFYLRSDETKRPYQLWRHELSTPNDQDVLVFEELDERYYVGVRTTKSEKFIVVSVESKSTSEERLLPANMPSAEPVCVRPREFGIEYSVEHDPKRNRLIIHNNINAVDFKLSTCALPTNPGELNETELQTTQWQDFVPARPDVRVDEFEVFNNWIAVFERSHAQQRIIIHDLATSTQREIPLPDDLATVYAGSNNEFDTSLLRFGLSSLTIPSSVYDFNVATSELSLLKRQEVLGTFSVDDYASQRLWITSGDGTKVPVSIVYRKTTPLDGTAPGLLYGYGAYEANMDPVFSSSRLSLLDRGFVYAIAHIRGGGELGRAWYLDGKLENKKHTFEDFVGAARALIEQKFVATNKLVIRGGSAGGLLIGATLNAAPELFAAAVAEVPFVDCLSTMLDSSLPLTTFEYEEWGNPEDDPGAYATIAAYSPIDNVRPAPYPRLLATGGLNDMRVGYWEPAKWVATLRDNTTSDAQIFLRLEMGNGHAGPSGRDAGWIEEAFVHAFVLDSVGLS